jgi:hypothetical protein
LFIDALIGQLDELLRQNSSLMPSVPSLLNGNPVAPPPRSKWCRLVIVVQNLLKGRATKNISLFLVSSAIQPIYTRFSYPIFAATRNYCYIILHYLPRFNSNRRGLKHFATPRCSRPLAKQFNGWRAGDRTTPVPCVARLEDAQPQRRPGSPPSH